MPESASSPLSPAARVCATALSQGWPAAMSTRMRPSASSPAICDAARFDVQHRSVVSGIVDDQVGPAADDQQLVPAGVGPGHGRHDLFLGGGAHQGAGRAADAGGGHLGEQRGVHCFLRLFWECLPARMPAVWRSGGGKIRGRAGTGRQRGLLFDGSRAGGRLPVGPRLRHGFRFGVDSGSGPSCVPGPWRRPA